MRRRRVRCGERRQSRHSNGCCSCLSSAKQEGGEHHGREVQEGDGAAAEVVGGMAREIRCAPSHILWIGTRLTKIQFKIQKEKDAKKLLPVLKR